ncbi:MAG: primosomal protein N' [Candidatus Peregrinibacteria bacterium]|nr:primosomal protein N' [Candidatus Peregrinibacteria bacterium]
MFLRVITSSRSPGIGNGLTYETEEARITPGSAVQIPLRGGHVDGIVFDVQREREEHEFEVKKVTALLASEPLLTEAQLKTLTWMARYYLTTLRQSLSVWLPPPPWRTLLPQAQTVYRLRKTNPALRSVKQKLICDYLSGKDWVSEVELKRAADATPAVLRTLLKNGVIERDRKFTQDDSEPVMHQTMDHPKLSHAQEEAYKMIRNSTKPSLLFGITGSGKTEIYASLIADCIAEGKQALLLVPEILLTEHNTERFERLVGRGSLAILHSKLTQGKRRAEWRRIHSGGVALVIGSRSALFAPLRKLGLVIIDEEHEWTYKNEQTPRYHTRDAAEVLCREAGARLILGTATPSMETWVKAKGEYTLVSLQERYRTHGLPSVRVIDLGDANFGQHYPFTTPLLDAIGHRLLKKEQSVLFLNRRGIASAVLCLQCRRRVISPDTLLPFTVHQDAIGRPYLLDHTSGNRADVPKVCPSCGSTRLLTIGAGTQRIELTVKKLFPTARVLRADSDTLSSPEDMRRLLTAMQEGRADILLGTQSVVKGLDLPGVTLAAVLIADIGLSLPHFRAGERVFQILTQLTGRSGRAKPGEVIIQTFRPDAPEVALSAKHETEKYLEQEMKLRLYTGYPPFTKMIRLLYRDDRAEERTRKDYHALLTAIEHRTSDAKVNMAPSLFGGGREWHILIRGKDPASLLSALALHDVSVDIDPLECV